MSGDINGLPGDNTRTREATKTGSETDGPEHATEAACEIFWVGTLHQMVHTEFKKSWVAAGLN